MNLLALTIFYGATTIPLVESGCFSFHWSTKNIDDLCKQWWDKAHDEYKAKPSAQKSCLQLIVKKCPNMITTTTSIIRTYDGNSRSRESWSTTVTVLLKDNTDVRMTYEKDKKKRRICYDDGVPACNYWWSVLTMATVEPKVKEVCIKRIWKHCPDKIERVSQVPNSHALHSKEGYKVVLVTYLYDGKITAFNRYSPL